MFNAVRSGSDKPEYKSFDDLDAAVAWVDERESGDVEEWDTGVRVYEHFPRVQFVEA